MKSNAKTNRQQLPLKKLLAVLWILITCLSLLLVSCTSVPTTGRPATEKLHEYPLPQARSSVMRPAVDQKGRVWFGEMGHNTLTMFDPQTQKFTQMTPPEGKSGIMGIVVALDNTIWFAEQSANYIGQYLPTTKKFQIYSLPQITITDPGNSGATLTLPSAPNDLAFDKEGNLWFTEMNADQIGKLNRQTGTIQHYPLSPNKSVQEISPYGIIVDKEGIVWFTEASSNKLGRLNPADGSIQRFPVPNLKQSLMELLLDTRGAIWATTFSHPNLIRFDRQQERFTVYKAQEAGDGEGGLYGLTEAHDGSIWVTITEANKIARMNSQDGTFHYIHLPTERSLPFGITSGLDQTLWFTESGSDQLGKLQL